MAKAKKSSKKSSDVKGLWKIYGSRMSNSGKRVNISILRADSTDDDKKFACISLPKKGTNKVKVKVKDDEIVLHIPRLDVEDEEDDEEDEDEDVEEASEDDEDFEED